MYTRNETKVINVGGVLIGGGNPIAVQSMANADSRNAAVVIEQVHRLAECGCEILRIAIPDNEAADVFRGIKKASPIPLIADIHFDYRLSVAAIKNGADMVRINPGNIGGADRVREVVSAAKSAGIPIRVGVNGGSLEKELYKKYGGITPQALCESVLNHINILEANSFYDIELSVKASDIPLTLETHKLICAQVNYPVHIGITEAGTVYSGTIKSAVGIGALLAMGVGDTVRVSLTADPSEEIKAAKEILKSFGLRQFGVNLISCPTCGRCDVDLFKMAHEVEDFCKTINTPMTVAVMGCEVNGPGEAAHADFGIACGKNSGVIFKKGKIVDKLPADQLASALITKIAAFCPETNIS